MSRMISSRVNRRASKWCLRSRFALVAAVAFIGAAHAEIATEDARLARLSWSAYRCAALAEWASKPDAQSRLLNLATDAGRRFIEGVKEGSISRESVMNHAPFGFVDLMDGPSTDFILGRVYGATLDGAEGAILAACDQCWIGSEHHNATAGNLYHKENCELLGR